MPKLLVPYDGSVSSYRAIQHVIEIYQEIELAQVAQTRDKATVHPLAHRAAIGAPLHR